MPLVTSPLFSLNSMYRPNKFLMSMTSANPLVLAQASIVVDAVGVTSISKSPLFSIGTTYYFEFDVAKLLQLYSAPKAQTKTTVFPDTLNVPVYNQNDDCHTYVGLIVTYYYNDPVTGLLTQHGTIDTIPYGYYAAIGTRQTRDWNNMGLDDYIMLTGSGNTPFLTNAPNPYSICPSENAFLTFVTNTCNAVRVITQDSSLAGIDEGLFWLAPDTTFVPATIGVGMTNLATQTYFQGSVNMADPNIAQYQIHVGNAYFFGSSYIFVQASETRFFKVTECCEERSVRLHWLNRLGGADAYTFSSKKTYGEKNKSQLAQIPQVFGYTAPPATIYSKGAFKIQQETQVEYEVEGKFYDEATGAWLAELLSSPEVYMETDAGLIAVVITDSNITIQENDELLYLTITFVEANNVSVQTN